MHLFVVISKFGLHSIGAKKYCCFRRTVDLITEDPFLHLKEEQLLRDVLNQLLRHVLREELGTESELERILLSDFLSRNLRTEVTPQLSRRFFLQTIEYIAFTQKKGFRAFVIRGE